jgi:hypothetical protein
LNVIFRPGDFLQGWQFVNLLGYRGLYVGPDFFFGWRLLSDSGPAVDSLHGRGRGSITGLSLQHEQGIWLPACGAEGLDHGPVANPLLEG